jgi:Ser/Thr protein kinase RdoA (MazF antagonist)
MQQSARRALESAFDSVRIVRELHDVPPHAVFEVEVDGERAVYKYDVGPTGSAGVEGRVQALVHAETSVPVPRVLAHGADHYVAAWHPSAPAPNASTTAGRTWARAAGRALATLHDETASVVDGYGAFEPTADGVHSAGHETWSDAVLAYAARHRRAIAEYGYGSVVDDVLEYLHAHPKAFTDAGEAVCCHGWATPEHVAVENDAVACVVDFEHAIAAPPAFDYWRTVHPTFDDDAGERAFRDGYRSVRDLPPALDEREPLYALLNAVYYFESLHVQDQHDRHETARRARGLTAHVHDLLDSFD